MIYSVILNQLIVLKNLEPEYNFYYVKIAFKFLL